VTRLLVALLLCASVPAQVAQKANQGYKTAEGRAAVARGLSAPNRDETQRPRELVESMNLRPGMKVADVGTGIGYMLPYLSHAVGPRGEVYAEDIATDFLAKAKLRASTLGLTNVKFILGTDHDPNLPGGILDAVLVLDTYHHFDYPESMLKGIRESLVSDGKLYIVDYYKRENAMGPGSGDRAIQHIRLDEDDVIREVSEHGFKPVGKREHIPGSQYVAVFEKTKEP
jgi:ubiquinone/menaquinone biosynthesis C-methylase UbiE